VQLRREKKGSEPLSHPPFGFKEKKKKKFTRHRDLDIFVKRKDAAGIAYQ
jgi:hypothetical protein